MEVTSEHPTRQVTDYLFVFSNGQRTTLTLRPGDTMEEFADSFSAQTHTELGDETTVYFKSQMLSFSVRTRQEIVYPEGESPVEKELKRLADEADRRQQAQHPLRRARMQPREGATV